MLAKELSYLFLVCSKLAHAQVVWSTMLVTPNQFTVEYEVDKMQSLTLCSKRCQELLAASSCEREIYIDNQNGKCKIGQVLAQGPQLKNNPSLIQIYMPPLRKDAVVKGKKIEICCEKSISSLSVPHFLTISSVIDDTSLDEVISPRISNFPAIAGRLRPHAWNYKGGMLMCGTNPDMACQQLNWATNSLIEVSKVKY